MTSKFLISFSAFAIFTLSSIGTKSEPIINHNPPMDINFDRLNKEQRLRALYNESDCLDYEIQVSAVKLNSK